MRRVVVVTGADSGIGRSSCARLAELGFAVTGVVADDEGAGRFLGDMPADPRETVEVLVADLGIPDARAGLLDHLETWALVNNAGYMNAGQLRDVPLDAARRQLETMVLAPVDLTHQVLPGMMARGQGRIVNVTSSAVHTSTPLTGWYAANKAALRELTDALRVELRPTGVDVVDIEPGGYRTGIWERAVGELRERRQDAADPGSYDRALGSIEGAFERMADPAEASDAIADVLTTGDPPAHVRVGPGARWLRMGESLVPDKLWDAVMAKTSGTV